jgi:hypothetical protein
MFTSLRVGHHVVAEGGIVRRERIHEELEIRE